MPENRAVIAGRHLRVGSRRPRHRHLRPGHLRHGQTGHGNAAVRGSTRRRSRGVRGSDETVHGDDGHDEQGRESRPCGTGRQASQGSSATTHSPLRSGHGDQITGHRSLQAPLPSGTAPFRHRSLQAPVGEDAAPSVGAPSVGAPPVGAPSVCAPSVVPSASAARSCSRRPCSRRRCRGRMNRRSMSV